MFKLSVPKLEEKGSYQTHKANINQMMVVSGGKSSCLLTCSDDMWVYVLDCNHLEKPLASYYVGAQVTCVTGFFDGSELFIQCTDSHGEISILTTEMDL